MTIKYQPRSQSSAWCQLLFVILCAVTADGHSQQTNFSKLVVFGDSLSDTGNLAVIDLPAPYFNNRISDGPVAADLIAQAIGSNAERSGHLLGLSGGFNYAVAGGNIDGADPEDVTQQVTAYLQRENNQADPDALYLVFAGGNDLRDIRSLVSASEAESRISQAAMVLSAQLLRLKNAGARAFLIPNVANIGRLPETIEREMEQPGIIARAEQYTSLYNLRLEQLVDDFGAENNIEVSLFDLFNAVEFLINNAAEFGFMNAQEGCFDTENFVIETECLIFGFESRVFFDGLHPSSASNQIIAQQVIAAIPSLPNERVVPITIAPILDLLLQ